MTVTDIARYREQQKLASPEDMALNVSVSNMPTGLAGMLKFVPKEAKTDLETAWFDWPALENASLKLYEYLTPYYPDKEGGLLFTNTIARAAQRYTVQSLQDGEASAEAMRVFMRTLIDSFDSLLSYSTYIVLQDGTTKLWHPVRNPLSIFMTDYRASGLSFNITSKYQFLRQSGKDLLIMQILSPGEALMLREKEGEDK